jgi:C4-type Zn-finger protein
MSLRQRPSIRHCPVCGIAMQASKSREDLAHFDVFECQNCHSVIREAKRPAADSDEKPR